MPKKKITGTKVQNSSLRQAVNYKPRFETRHARVLLKDNMANKKALYIIIWIYEGCSESS